MSVPLRNSGTPIMWKVTDFYLCDIYLRSPEAASTLELSFHAD